MWGWDWGFLSVAAPLITLQALAVILAAALTLYYSKDKK